MSSQAPGRWPLVEFKSLVAHSAFGPRFGGELYSDEGNVATLRTTDLSASGEISYDSMPLAKIDENRFADHFLRTGDLVISRSGRIGTTAIFRGFSLPVLPGAFLIRFRLVEDVQPAFFCYFFNSQGGQALLQSVARGAAQQNINTSNVLRLRVPLPSKSAQSEIVRLLSQYDDLIENNRRRIALLEEAARQLYKEWFVRFRFPGHEHVKIIDGVPEEWERVTIGAITTKLGSGATPRGGSASYQDSGITLIRSQNVYDFRFEDDGLVHLTEEQADKLGNVIVRREDILLNITGASVARCCQVPERLLPARVNQHVMIVRADKALCPPNFLLHSINSNQNKEKLLSIARAGGATREALTKDTVAGFEVLMPPKPLLAAFDMAAQPLVDQAHTLSAMNEQLARARDLLLPKLMSGAIAV